MSQTSKRTYLIFADGSDEFSRSLRYAALAAKANKADIRILHVLQEQEFQHWAGVEERMRAEQQTEADAYLKDIVSQIKSIGGIEAKYDIENGSKTDAVIKTLEQYPEIKKLIVTSTVSGGEKGALLSYFTGAGADKLPVTLTIVPGHVEIDRIDTLLN